MPLKKDLNIFFAATMAFYMCAIFLNAFNSSAAAICLNRSNLLTTTTDFTIPSNMCELVCSVPLSGIKSALGCLSFQIQRQKRTSDFKDFFVADMCVNLGGFYTRMAKDFLDMPD